MREKYNLSYVWKCSFVAALGGLLFGYDWVVIGGAKPFYELYFDLTTSAQVGWAMSSALLGCLVGSMLSGALSDRLGRKRLLLAAGFLFTISAVGTALSVSFNVFIMYRLLGGIGIGLASNLAPMYISELAPPALRGKFVSMNQLAIVIGILAAQLTNWLIAKPVAADATAAQILASWNGQVGWRWMFGAETVPAVFFFAAMFFIPESPRWLVKNAKPEAAKEILAKVGGPDYRDSAIADIRKSLENEINKVDYRELLEPRLLRILLVGVALAVLQQWCGINVIFNYAEDIFSAAGFGVSDILFNIVITGSVNLVFTFIALFTVDRLGRRPLLLIGTAGLCGVFILLGLSYLLQSSGLHVLFLVVLAIGIYGMSLAPVVWVVISEIFPNRIRGAAMSVSVSALWIACFVLTYTFPYLNEGLGAAGTFWVYAGICLVGFWFIKKRLPETKGKSLEEIEKELLG